jgi:hypothetical protein
MELPEGNFRQQTSFFLILSHRSRREKNNLTPAEYLFTFLKVSCMLSDVVLGWC